MRPIALMSVCLFTAAIMAPVPGVAGTTAPSSIELSAQKRAPSATCERNKQACMSGSARTGNYGARYVPPEAVRMCMDQYRACIGRH